MIAIEKKGFTLIETLVVVALLGVVLLVFLALFKYGMQASDRGKIAAQSKENARVAIERVQSELRQAVSVPANCGNSVFDPPAVILPGPGTYPGAQGGFGNSESAGVGCSLGFGKCIGAGDVSPVNSDVQIPSNPPAIQQTSGGPEGFLIFSEIVQQTNASGSPYVPPQQSYISDPDNYVWVMYLIYGPQGAPPQLLRYTFTVGQRLNGLVGGCGNTGGSWARNDDYFVPKNSREVAEGINPEVVVSLTGASDQLWMMVSHTTPSQEVETQTGDLLDPQLFNLVNVTAQSSMLNTQSSAGQLTATVSSQVKVEGALSSNSY